MSDEFKLSSGAAGWQVVTSGSATGSITGADAPGLVNSMYTAAHSGHLGAAFGSINTLYDRSLQQAISTTPGGLFELHFWLLNPDPAATVNLFSVKWGGVEVRPIGTPAVGTNWVITPGTVWTEYVVPNLTASSATTTLSFSAVNSGWYTWLDDVTIVSVPEPATSGIFAVGTFGLTLLRRRSRVAV